MTSLSYLSIQHYHFSGTQQPRLTLSPFLFSLTPGGSLRHRAGGKSGVPRGGELGPHHLPLRGGGGSGLGLR